MSNSQPTASFECINNSTPLHLSSLASYTVHSSPSPSFSSQPCVYLDGFPYRNFWIWMRNSKMRFQLPCSPAMSCRLLLSVRSDDKHQRCRLLLHYWVVVICWTTGGFSTLVLITQQRIIWWLFLLLFNQSKRNVRGQHQMSHTVWHLFIHFIWPTLHDTKSILKK